MSFDVYVDSKSESKKVSNIDYDKLNSYVVETAGMEEATVLPGVISMIVDLGVQAQSDAEYVFDGDEEQEAAEIKNNPNVRFETRERFYDDGKWLKNVRVKVVPHQESQ